MEGRFLKGLTFSERALKALTDTVVATSGGYSELEGATRALIQVNSKGKLSLEELNRHKHSIFKLDTFWLQTMIKEYQEKLDDLS